MQTTKNDIILGYRNGFAYLLYHGNVYRAEYDLTAMRWYSSLYGFQTSIEAHGPLFDKDGNEVDLSHLFV